MVRSLTGMVSLLRVLGVARGEANLESSTCPMGSKFIRTKCMCMCDFHNNRIQVFDLELSFITSFGTEGTGKGQYDRPNDLAFDAL